MTAGSQFRDGHGRLVGLGHLLGFALAGFVIGLAALLVLDAVLALTGVSRFGRANGWLAVILPVWLFVEEFRAEGASRGEFRQASSARRRQPGRVPAALVGVAVGLALGTLANGLAGDLPPLASGAIGAAVAILAYSLVWFYGIRWLGGRAGGRVR
jgi:hypothetical protein